MKSSIVRIAIAALALGTAQASAQVIISEGGQPVQEQPYQEPQQQSYQQQPYQQQQQPVQQPFADQPAQPVQQPQPQPQAEQRLMRQLSAYLSVPFMLTNGSLRGTGAQEDVGAGFGIHGRFGWELGFLVLEAQVGWMIMTVDTDAAFESVNLQDVWVGLGARFQFLNRSRLVPFVSAAFRANFITVGETGSASAGTRTAYEFEPGAQVGLGLTVELTRNFGLEAAVTANFMFGTGDTFDEFQTFLQPWIGATLYI